MEFTGGEFLHLALVPNPRYERANIVMNSEDEKEEKQPENIKDTVLDAISEVVTNCLGECRNAKIDRNKCYHSEKNGRYVNKYSYEAQEYMMTILAIDITEFKYVESEIDKWYYNKYKNEETIEHHMPDFVYYAANHGFHKYLFFDKIPNVQVKEFKQWNT